MDGARITLCRADRQSDVSVLGSSLSGLGTHLTMSLSNEIRFGPDVEWLDPPRTEDGEDVPDFWESKLAVSEERLELAVNEVKKFLPGVDASGFSPDCEPSSFVHGCPAIGPRLSLSGAKIAELTPVSQTRASAQNSRPAAAPRSTSPSRCRDRASSRSKASRAPASRQASHSPNESKRWCGSRCGDSDAELGRRSARQGD